MGDDQIFVLRVWREEGDRLSSASLRANFRHINSGRMRHAAGAANICAMLRQSLAEAAGLGTAH